jgi:hypothetical protein
MILHLIFKLYNIEDIVISRKRLYIDRGLRIISYYIISKENFFLFYLLKSENQLYFNRVIIVM